MAEIVQGSNHRNKRAGVARAKKLSTRVDLTPMVDLGFLLITFFIFTTTMSHPKVMGLVVPDDKGDATPTKQSGTLTIIPADDHKVYYYEGSLDSSAMKKATLKQLRDVIINKKRKTALSKLVVIIKPSVASVYGDLIDVIDEMIINDVKTYALVDITAQEEALIK